MSRRIAGIVIIDGVDDETFGANETTHVERTVDTVVNSDQPISVMSVRHGWGGECRVELELTARLIGTGTVQIEGVAKLFEGTSEDTTDLEEQKGISFIVPKGGIPAHQTIVVSNSGFGGGDSATIKCSLTNSLIEDPD